MKLKLEKVKTSEGSWEEVKEHGILKSLLAKTDIINFSQKNLENDEVRVTLFIKENADDSPKMLFLSERLSKVVRKLIARGKHKLGILRALVELRVIENEDGRHFLIMSGTPTEGKTLADILKEEVVSLGTVTLEDVIA